MCLTSTSRPATRSARVWLLLKPSRPCASMAHDAVCLSIRRSTSLASPHFIRAYPIFVEVVAVGGFPRQSAVGVAFPPAAQINRFVDAANRILAANPQAGGVILTVAYIRKTELAKNGRVKRSWGAQSVDAERIVAAVCVRPFTMVDQAG